MRAAALLAAALVASVCAGARANERHFTYTYESATLPRGAKELEVWTTWRGGRDRFFSGFDHRVEFEVGVTDRLQTSLYINFSSAVEDDAAGVRRTSFDYGGISNEWKLKVLDPIKDAIGFAPYLELSGSPDYLEIEGKLLFDKKLGKTLLAANLVGAHEMRFGADATSHATELHGVVGAAYFFTPTLTVGGEGRAETEIGGEGWEHTVFYLGPTVAYSSGWWWAALTASRQLAGVQSGPSRSFFVFEEHEYYQVRLLFSFHI